MTPSRRGVVAAGYAVTGAWCWVLYSYGAVLQLLRDEQGTTRLVTGLHSLALATGSVLTGLVAARLLARLGRRRLLLVAFGTAGAGAAALCLPLGPAATLPAALLFGTGGSMTVTAWLPVAGLVYGEQAPAVLSRWLAAAAAVGIVSPLVVAASVARGAGWRPALLVVLVLFAGAVLLLRRIPAGAPFLDGTSSSAQAEAPAPGPRVPRAARRPLALVVVLVAIEFTCTAWVTDLLAQRTGLTLAAAASGVTAVLVGMTASRAAGGRLALKYPSRVLLTASLVVTGAGWAVAWLSTHPAPALAGLVVVGLGVGAHYPLAVGLALESVPGAEDRTVGAISVGIGLSSGLGPFALGALADARGTHQAFLVVPVLVVACLLLLGDPRRHLGADQRRTRPQTRPANTAAAAANATAPQPSPPPPTVDGAGDGAGDRPADGVRDGLGRVVGEGEGAADADSAALTGPGRATRSTGSPTPSDDRSADRPSAGSASPSPWR